MKNWKKIVAAFAAVAMTLSIGSVAFATDPNGSADYDKDAGTATVTPTFSEWTNSAAGSQWTVIIIDKANENKTLEASDLKYINQGTTADGFWTAMGTKETLTDGDYIVRIGGTNLTGYKDIPLTVSTTSAGPVYMLGDAYVDGIIDLADASAVLGHILGTQLIANEAALLAADAYVDNVIDLADASAILGHILGTQLLVQD